MIDSFPCLTQADFHAACASLAAKWDEYPSSGSLRINIKRKVIDTHFHSSYVFRCRNRVIAKSFTRFGVWTVYLLNFNKSKFIQAEDEHIPYDEPRLTAALKRIRTVISLPRGR